MASTQKNTTFIPAANRALEFVQQNVDAQGWLTNATNPYTFSEQLAEGEHSPEGQAFVLLLHAAWRVFVQSLPPPKPSKATPPRPVHST